MVAKRAEEAEIPEGGDEVLGMIGPGIDLVVQRHVLRRAHLVADGPGHVGGTAAIDIQDPLHTGQPFGGFGLRPADEGGFGGGHGAVGIGLIA